MIDSHSDRGTGERDEIENDIEIEIETFLSNSLLHLYSGLRAEFDRSDCDGHCVIGVYRGEPLSDHEYESSIRERGGEVENVLATATVQMREWS